jgi:hypothetical protein
LHQLTSSLQGELYGNKVRSSKPVNPLKLARFVFGRRNPSAGPLLRKASSKVFDDILESRDCFFRK